MKKKPYHLHKIKHRHTGVNSIDYYAYASRLGNLNALYKTAFAFLTMILCIAADSLWVSAYVVLTMAIFTIAAGGLPIRNYLSCFTVPAPFLIMGSIAILTDFAPEPKGDWFFHLHFFYLFATKKNLIKALSVLGRALGAVSAGFLLVLSTPANEIILMLWRLHVPKVVVELMHMIYRFIFMILQTHREMHYAAESRLGYVDFKTSIKTFGSTAGNLLLLSLKKANTYYDALEARGYDGELRFLEEKKELKTRHVIAALLYFSLLLILWGIT